MSILRDVRDSVEEAQNAIRLAKEAPNIEISREFLCTARLLLDDAIDAIVNVADDIDSASRFLEPNREA